MSKGKDMSVLVMDVEGTDGRERGEDQVRFYLLRCRILLMTPHRTLSESRLSSPLQSRRSSSSTSGSTKLDSTRAPTWDSSRPSSKSTSPCSSQRKIRARSLERTSSRLPYQLPR